VVALRAPEGGTPFDRPEGIGADEEGFVYVAEAGPPNRIVKAAHASRLGDRRGSDTGAAHRAPVVRRPQRNRPRATLTVSGLKVGTHAIRLTVTAGGRTGSTTRVIRIRSVKREIISLTTPPLVTRTARTLRLTIRTNVAATLTYGRTRVAVGPRAKTVSFKLTPGRTALRLALVLRAGGLVNRPVVTVPRL
jgi:hypothetical protein